MKTLLFLSLAFQAVLCGQEADSGLDLRATISVQGAYSERLAAAPRSGEPVAGGFRSVLYPNWKLSPNWTLSGALQISSRPYFFEQFSTQGYGLKTDVLQAHLSYSRFWKKSSVVFRTGLLSSAFGSFLLRYDDAVNPLIDMPMSYGYYYKRVSTLGLAGAQIDATFGKVDLRAQFVNSSPANRRSVFDRDQYGNWTAGSGYTIAQGFRVGVSAYRGPYLHRQYAFYFPGEAKPRGLPATALGADAQWARGHWNVSGEWQRFQLAYRAIPAVNTRFAYGEITRTLHPRWYVAARISQMGTNISPDRQTYEFAVGFRPNMLQLLKIGYQIQQAPNFSGASGNTLALQIITTLHPFSIAGN